MDMTETRDFKTRVLDSPWTIIIGIAIFGPFALPLLWRNPKYSRATKTFWTVLTAIITLFCLWVMKHQVQIVSQAMGAEPCKIEKYRPAYPPGQRAAKIFVGTDTKKPVAKFSETKELFDYLKQADGKICAVNWSEAKDVIENWMHPSQSAEETVGPEIKTLIERQSAPTTQAQVVPVVQVPQKTCESSLLEIRDRLNALKSKTYDSQKTRSAEIDSMLRSVEPGPLK